MDKPIKVKILGTTYRIYLNCEDDDIDVKHSGVCKYASKTIKVKDISGQFSDEQQADFALKALLRHEIVHAFISESGLHANTLEYCNGWADNEEMVDWIALQHKKLHKAFKKAGAL